MSGKEAYQAYIKTDKWKTIRAQRLAMDNDKCVLCGEKAEHVHHRRYKDWGTETVNDLVCLCGECHGKHHGITNENIFRISDDGTCVTLLSSDIVLGEMEFEAFHRTRNGLAIMLESFIGQKIDSKMAKKQA